MAMLTEIGLLTGLVAALAVLLAWSRRRFPRERDPVVDAINDLLPQTQCAQCGFPGCRPYAEAVAAGAPIDLCPPGGEPTQQKLAELLGRPPGALLRNPPAAIARIDESRCIGCFLCVDACPVDAIVGAPHFLHTVVAERCTGCELCLPPCPVDCIELLEVARPSAPPFPADAAACIRCNRCDPVCPESLPVARLWSQSRAGSLAAAVESGLEQCIECGLCNAQCPSELDLVGTFRAARGRLAQEAERAAAAAIARRHADSRSDRLAREASAADARRAARLAGLRAGVGGPTVRDNRDG